MRYVALAFVMGLSLATASPASAAESAASGDFSGLVDIGGRKLYLECRGTGSPTVILIAGYRNDAEIWSVESRARSDHGPSRRGLLHPGLRL